MTFWDIDNLISSKVDKVALAESICDSPAIELVDTYKNLCEFIEKLLKFPNIPEIIYILFELKYAYGFEILNRWIDSHKFLVSQEVPDECVKGDYDTLENIENI